MRKALNAIYRLLGIENPPRPKRKGRPLPEPHRCLTTGLGCYRMGKWGLPACGHLCARAQFLNSLPFEVNDR